MVPADGLLQWRLRPTPAETHEGKRNMLHSKDINLSKKYSLQQLTNSGMIWDKKGQALITILFVFYVNIKSILISFFKKDDR